MPECSVDAAPIRPDNEVHQKERLRWVQGNIPSYLWVYDKLQSRKASSFCFLSSAVKAPTRVEPPLPELKTIPPLGKELANFRGGFWAYNNFNAEDAEYAE
ncbi:MAG: hypothetical protein DCC75_04985 [Proteobacteria bacterium]|nr:MAG: hypothetical protein DCC75_04985 [Pseudomonadota bacterium]